MTPEKVREMRQNIVLVPTAFDSNVSIALDMHSDVVCNRFEILEDLLCLFDYGLILEYYSVMLDI